MSAIDELVCEYLETRNWEISRTDISIDELESLSPGSFDGLAKEHLDHAIAVVRPSEVSPKTHEIIVNRNGVEAWLANGKPVPMGWRLKPSIDAPPGQMALAISEAEAEGGVG